jgi:hypothetical protein
MIVENCRYKLAGLLWQFKAWVAAAVIFIAIESLIYAVAAPALIERTNFLQFSFLRPEPAQRLFMFHKLKTFENSNPTIVQTGDSSGFYGIDPRVVMKHLPAGESYLNMSCCANLGFRGYYNVFEFMLRHNRSIKYLVLHITPYTMPLPETWDRDGISLWGPGVEVFGEAIDREFIGPWHFMRPPSMAYRGPVTNFVYYLGPLINGAPVVSNAATQESSADTEPPVDILRAKTGGETYLEFLRNYRDSHGWTPERDVRAGVFASECDIPVPEFFDFRTMSRKTYVEEIFDAYAGLADRHNVKLVIVFQPVACVLGTGRFNARARAIVEQFKITHPNVAIPFPLIETWPVDIFSVPAHVRREYTDRIGDRLGKAMAEIVAGRGS